MITVAHDDVPVVESTLRSVSSLVLGDLEVNEAAVFTFPTPLFGFPTHAEFALLPATRAGLWWLQSMHDGAVTFLLADPFVVDPEYGVDLGETEKSTLQIAKPTDVLGLVMVTLPPDGASTTTANFRAPLVLNVVTRIGLQVVDRKESADLRRPVALDVFPHQEAGIALR